MRRPSTRRPHVGSTRSPCESQVPQPAAARARRHGAFASCDGVAQTRHRCDTPAKLGPSAGRFSRDGRGTLAYSAWSRVRETRSHVAVVVAPLAQDGLKLWIAIARHRGEEVVLELVLHPAPEPLGEGIGGRGIARRQELLPHPVVLPPLKHLLGLVCRGDNRSRHQAS